MGEFHELYQLRLLPRATSDRRGGGERRTMTPTESFYEHWYFHLPNLVLAALLYTLAGRYILELFFQRNQDAVILKVFRSITDPVLKLVRVVTPGVVPNGLVIIFAVVWLMGLRLFLYLTMLAAGTMKLG